MIAILSPAMNMGSCKNSINMTTPIYIEETRHLASILKDYNPFEIESKLNLTPNQMEKIFRYYQEFVIDNNNEIGTPSILSFQGTAYKSLKANEFDEEEILFANNSIRILSAMYGILKPTDCIQPYRLDFVCRFAKEKINDKKLYDFWGDKVYKELFSNNEIVINLCSAEYEKLIRKYLKPSDKFITIKFLINKNGKFKSMSVDAKRNRGNMARYIVKNKIYEPELLKEYDEDGYTFSDYHSNENEYVFIK